jgi:Amt family ammonium transporter
VQLKGIGAVAVFTLAVSLVFWYAVKATLGLRVSKQEELEGLDVGEHGEVAYVIGSGRLPELEQVAS